MGFYKEVLRKDIDSTIDKLDDNQINIINADLEGLKIFINDSLDERVANRRKEVLIGVLLVVIPLLFFYFNIDAIRASGSIIYMTFFPLLAFTLAGIGGLLVGGRRSITSQLHDPRRELNLKQKFQLKQLISLDLLEAMSVDILRNKKTLTLGLLIKTREKLTPSK